MVADSCLETNEPLVPVEELRRRLLNRSLPIPKRFRALFSLRNLTEIPEAADALIDALKEPSALLRHEVAFCLGQMVSARAIPILTAILDDETENSMVRHEAGEALGAIGTDECLAPLLRHKGDSLQEVAETCQLALRRIDALRQGAAAGKDGAQPYSVYKSIDPVPAGAAQQGGTVEGLRATLLDESVDLFDRYAALFALRAMGGHAATEAIASCFGSSSSALLKHEAAYVLGQMQDDAVVGVLTQVLRDEREHCMVRHEAAEALGSIAEASCEALLQEYTQCADAVVAESCCVALDLMAHERAGDFQYADVE
eukprot:jgi/Mesvir1/25041/Mv16980-RA.1